MEYEILTSIRSRLAEGPLYHPEEDVIYYTDIDSGLLHRHDPKDSKTETVHQGSMIGGFTLQEDGSLLLFREDCAIERLKDGEIVVLFENLPGELESRFNDVSADPAGRVFCGSMSSADGKGKLYRLDLDGTIRVVLEDIGCSNGMGWSPDNRTMYYTDSDAQTIYRFDYDEETGEISNQNVLFQLQPGEGLPDGMTVDSDGNLWVAVWDGHRLLHLNPQGEILQTIPLPAKKITCPIFGGKDLDELYVTAAGGHTPEEGIAAGELMRLRPGVKGRPEFRSKIQVKVS